MATEEQAQDYVIRVFESGTRISVELGKFTASKLFQLLGIGIRAASNVLHDIRHSGQVSAKMLQQDNTSLKVEEIDTSATRDIVKELKKAGVAFHIERDRQTGKVYLHFAGQDADEVRHAVDKIVARLNAEATRREQTQEQVQEQTSPQRSETVNEDEETHDVEHAQQAQEQDQQLRTESRTWDRDSPHNPYFDFTTIDADPHAAIIAVTLAEQHIPFRQETINEHTQRFSYPVSQAPQVAQTLETIIARTPSLDWDRVNVDDRTQPNESKDEQQQSKPHLKTKDETLQNIKQRAQQRAEQSKGAPKQTHARTR